MIRRRISILAALAFALCLPAAALAQSVVVVEPRYQELPNFYQVNQGLYRGAQPRVGGIHRLKELGIKTIINLRAADDRARAEETEARSLGLSYFNIPMEGLDRPRDEQVEQALKLIDDAANQPVFVHCKRGADRTGTVIAIYRIIQDGWTSDAALREAKHYGMSWLEFRMKDYIKDYGRGHAKRRAGAESIRLSAPLTTTTLIAG